ncbi:2-keto-4-pentenoate hydratase [Phenylobacterium sp. Root700]|uniref:2-keto-4-pentenoate hydratase n=1 Tax=Phenylobacterium sp. Root700 TaxID=1736591 RepID=UPI0009EBFC33|nr:fumarylacetoacetate hydrolase family protein [Phenylobacterium sp. Root700]
MTTVSEHEVAKAATRLSQAASGRDPCAPVRDLIGPENVEAAYAVQESLTKAALASGRRLVGRKIGLTAVSVQRQLGVDQPDYGMLFDDMDVPNGGDIPFGALLQPKCEAEIAFILGGDLDTDRLTSADVLSSIEWAVAAIEVVDSRIAGWDITIADTIADNASSGRFVLGHELRRLNQIDLVACGMALEKRGEVVSTGAGVACLGSPLNAVLWLARTMARIGRPLRRGDVVLSGALGPMVAAAPGDRFLARVEGLGSVSVGFEGAPQ